MRISDWSSDVCSSDLKKQVSLTKAGQHLLEITRRLFDVEKQALELLTESRALRSESLRVVADSAHHMLHILARFRERYPRSEEHTSELQSLMRNSYAVVCLKKKKK